MLRSLLPSVRQETATTLPTKVAGTHSHLSLWSSADHFDQCMLWRVWESKPMRQDTSAVSRINLISSATYYLLATSSPQIGIVHSYREWAKIKFSGQFPTSALYNRLRWTYSFGLATVVSHLSSR